MTLLVNGKSITITDLSKYLNILRYYMYNARAQDGPQEMEII